jgi:hypothetical protein
MKYCPEENASRREKMTEREIRMFTEEKK